MKFKVTKIATAVAAGLGVSVAGMNVARADAVLFPYFAVSNTVTSVVTSINLARQGAVSSVNPQTLHYRLYYKRGANAESLTASCEEFNVRRITSPNDVVTFDLLGKYGDELGVLGEPANRQVKAKYSPNQSFALMKGLTPARGFMVIDNDEAVNAPFEPSLFGEIMLIDYAEGAVWGYAAYNAAPSGAALPYNFEDGAENNGEVLAGNRAVSATQLRGGVSPAVLTNILPLNSQTPDKDAVITKFFVTPIDHWVTVNGVPVPTAGRPSQLNPALSTRVQLQVSFDTATTNDVMFDRDENPVSGQTPRTVTCVGAVLVDDLLSAGALQEIGLYGGWSGVEISSPGSLLTGGTTGTRTDNTNQAVVIKLEYNPDAKFLGDTFKGAFNNAIWLRYGIRESIRPAVQTAAAAVSPRVVIRSATDGNGQPIDVANDFPPDGQLSVLQ